MSQSRSSSPSRPLKAAHLTEFYPYLINNDNNPNSLPKSTPTTSHSRAQSISNTIGTINTTNTLQSILTKTDIQKTSAIYNEILQSCEDYRESLGKVVETAANFGNALEKLSKLKGSDEVNEELLNVSGFFYLISNHQEILNQSIKQYFETPINREINNFNLKISNNDDSFKSEYKALLKELKLKESENLKLSKSKNKNLNIYKSKLLQLTSHLDSIEGLKQDYYAKSLELVESSNTKILHQLGTITRAQVEIYENIAKKGWSGGGLDVLIAQSSDPFNPEYDAIEEESDDEGEDDDTLKLQQQQQDTPSPFSAIRNGSKEPFGDISIDQELGPEDDGHNTPSILAEAVNIPNLTHQHSIRTLSQEYVNDQSTPIKSGKEDSDDKLKDNLSQEIQGESEWKQTNETTKLITALQLEDDNSFSLPIPGSSSKILNSNTSDREEEIENEEVVDTNGKNDVQDFIDHNEWDQ